MRISFKIPEGVLTRVKAGVERRVAEKMDALAVTIYNSIVTGPQPVWSGAYASSWSIGIGSPVVIDNVSPKMARGGPSVTFAPAEPLAANLGMTNPYEPIYISNYSMRSGDAGVIEGHAGIIENVGSPRHPSPWNIAAHARNSALQTLRLV